MDNPLPASPSTGAINKTEYISTSHQGSETPNSQLDSTIMQAQSAGPQPCALNTHSETLANTTDSDSMQASIENETSSPDSSEDAEDRTAEQPVLYTDDQLEELTSNLENLRNDYRQVYYHHFFLSKAPPLFLSGDMILNSHTSSRLTSVLVATHSSLKATRTSSDVYRAMKQLEEAVESLERVLEKVKEERGSCDQTCQNFMARSRAIKKYIRMQRDYIRDMLVRADTRW